MCDTLSQGSCDAHHLDSTCSFHFHPLIYFSPVYLGGKSRIECDLEDDNIDFINMCHWSIARPHDRDSIDCRTFPANAAEPEAK